MKLKVLSDALIIATVILNEFLLSRNEVSLTASVLFCGFGTLTH